jgi:hypothetical protein
VAEIPAEAKPLLDAYLAALGDQLPGFADGVFIHGSVALGAYNPRSSDLDVVTVISRAATADDVERLRQIHASLTRRFPKPLLEVTYLQPDDLGRDASDIAPHPYFHDGALRASGHFDENPITWWVLKNRGIALLGTLPDFAVDWDALVAETHANTNQYWARYTREPARIASLMSDFGIQWAVLGVLRQYYTFAARGITSKDGAGQYALEHLPSRWHRLVREALDIRQESYTPAYPLRLLRAVDAWRFLRWIIGECNRQRTSEAGS